MQWKKRNLRELANMVIGDNANFKYRSSSYITEFFEDCDLDYRHDGTTRWAWTSSTLEEILSTSVSQNKFPDAFIRILRALMDKGDAHEDDPDRSIALSALNVTLQREGWEAYYDDRKILQLRNVATHTG